MEAIRQCILVDPSASTRRRSAQLGIARKSLQKILKLDSKMFPTGWSYCSHCQGDGEPPARNFRRTNHLKNAKFVWPPRSSDFTAPDLFLWGYLKKRVYVNKPGSIKKLKESIRAKSRCLRPETLRTVMENVVERALFVSRKTVVF
jgi:hypothetical protein